MTDDRKQPEVRVRPYDYQPTKAECEEPVHIDATPEDVIRTAFQQVKVAEERNA